MQSLLHGLLQRSAERYPDRPAVIDRGRVLTYQELDTRTDRLAHLLIEQGARPGDRIGLYLDKSAEAVTAIYGVLKAGCTYVPLDPDAPDSRVRQLIEDCRIGYLLSGPSRAGAWPALTDPGSPLKAILAFNVSSLTSEPNTGIPVIDATTDTRNAAAPSISVSESSPAYILYTSGSTGRPKGVTLSHSNGLAFVEWAAKTFEVSATDRLSSHAPLHFDLSIFDLFAAAAGGAAVVLVPGQTSVFPAELARFISDNQITVWYSVPSILTMLSLRGSLADVDMSRLRTVLFAGEVFPKQHLRRLMSLVPAARYFNLYGPTETNVCTWYEVRRPEREDPYPIPIGRAIDGVEVFAVTSQGRVAEPGEEGELHVHGPTVMSGYWEAPELTAEVLVRDPRATDSGAVVYRTGDIVVRLDDGNYRFLGRRDSQIKTRGYRVELGDIEAALNEHPAVLESVVVPVPDELVTNRIEAFVSVTDTVTTAQLSAFCATRLPRYMIPERFEMVDSIPKTSTGKIDRRAFRS